MSYMDDVAKTVKRSIPLFKRLFDQLAAINNAQNDISEAYSDELDKEFDKHNIKERRLNPNSHVEVRHFDDLPGDVKVRLTLWITKATKEAEKAKEEIWKKIHKLDRRLVVFLKPFPEIRLTHWNGESVISMFHFNEELQVREFSEWAETLVLQGEVVELRDKVTELNRVDSNDVNPGDIVGLIIRGSVKNLFRVEGKTPKRQDIKARSMFTGEKTVLKPERVYLVLVPETLAKRLITLSEKWNAAVGRVKTSAIRTAVEFLDPLKGVRTTGPKLTGREIRRAIRLAICAEHEAVATYRSIAEQTDNELVKKVFEDIAEEEIVHIGEFMDLMTIVDPEEVEHLKEGIDEVGEILEDEGWDAAKFKEASESLVSRRKGIHTCQVGEDAAGDVISLVSRRLIGGTSFTRTWEK